MTSTSPDRREKARASWFFTGLATLALFAAYAAFMTATNHRLTILDDEATIIQVANKPADAMLSAFLHGGGQHEHPPLSDMVLHFWLVATHRALAWIRVSATLFFMPGLWILARCGERLGNRKTYWAVLLLGTMWPFGYFYARIAGWYCFCFLLVALLTWTYLRLIEEPGRLHWAVFTAVSILLLWSNYFGVAILLVLLGDLVLNRRIALRANAAELAACILLSALSFLPFLNALMNDAHGTIKPASDGLLTMALKAGYMFFALLASVAVAPWFLPWGIPAGLAMLVLLAGICLHVEARRFAFCFFLLIAGLALSSHLDLKRLLFVTPWLLLAIALACSQVRRLSLIVACVSILVVFAIGWIGIATGLHPATMNFYEPWKAVADRTAEEAGHGEAKPESTIVSDSNPYFFYLNYAFGLEDTPAYGSYLGGDVYSRRGVRIYLNELPRQERLSGPVIAVEGVDTVEPLKMMSATLDRLLHSCRLLASERSTPDPAIRFKPLLGSAVPMLPYRVVVDHFDCDAAPR